MNFNFSKMKIFAISVVKNEVDIIAQSLHEAAKWADKIFVMDNGSEDGTWELVQSLASDKIVAWKQLNIPFKDGIRALVFNEFRHLAKDDDWWCYRLDADEFYVDDPRVFLSKIQNNFHFVATDTIQFRLTKEDFLDKKFPAGIEDIKYHDKKTWSEARFFRYRKKMIWTPEMARPKHMGILYPKRIKVRHYQYRSIEQIVRRVSTRRQAKEWGFSGFDYSSNEEVNSYLYNRKDLNFYEGNNIFDIEGSVNNLFQKKYDIIIKGLFHYLGIYK